MNWYKAKTILIVFLMIVNVSLFTYICFDNADTREKEEKVINTVISLLENKNITVDKKLILEQNQHKTIETAYAENIISDYAEFSEHILGTGMMKSSENTYFSDTGVISFKDNSFNAKAVNGKVLKEYKTDKSSLKKNALDYAEYLGVNTKNVRIILSGNENKFTASISKQINSHPVFCSGLTLIFSPEGVISAEGTWYTQTESDGSQYELRNISGILADYMNTAPNSSKITSITLGYSTVQTDVFYKNVSFIPVWEIKDDLNNVHYIDARETR